MFPFRGGSREMAPNFERETDKGVSIPGRLGSLVKGLRNHVREEQLKKLTVYPGEETGRAQVLFSNP